MRALLVFGVLTAFAAGPARADDYADPSGKALIAMADFRLVGVGGDRSWLDGGLGKSRFGGDRPDGPGDFHARARAIEGDLTWSPEFLWSFGATIAATAQRGQDKAIDLSEAFLTWRSAPLGRVKLSARAGLFWPPVSLEHSGPEWRVAETITPSAINSWIGEEVKLAGAEATLSVAAGGGRIAATGAVFGYNDTSGTLLAFRGWALHDEKATAFSYQPLPPLDAFMRYAQAPSTRPVIELDHRAGYYAALAWSFAAPVKVEALYYDNRGDPEAYDAGLQWGWRTQFASIGARAELGAVRLTAQGMSGRTRMGFASNGLIWVDTRFRSAFALATLGGKAGTISGRIEAFATRGRGSVLGRNESEDGWAATLAARHPIGAHVSLLGELLHIDSRRDARLRLGLEPRQRQTVAQLSLRLRT